MVTRRQAPAQNAAPVAYKDKHLALLKSAARLFADQGFHDSSIRDLSRVSGRSLSGLYYYFSGKEELLFQIQHHCYGTLLETVRGALAEVKDPSERLLTFISHHITFFRHNMDEMKVLAHEDLTLRGDYSRRILDLKRKYSETLVDIVAAFETEISTNGTHHASPEIAAFTLFGAMNWIYTWPRRLRTLPANELAEAIAQIFICGYPGCPPSTLSGLRDNILCSPQRFWQEAVPSSGGRASEDHRSSEGK